MVVNIDNCDRFVFHPYVVLVDINLESRNRFPGGKFLLDLLGRSKDDSTMSTNSVWPPNSQTSGPYWRFLRVKLPFCIESFPGERKYRHPLDPGVILPNLKP
jgi:hypothetical protein